MKRKQQQKVKECGVCGGSTSEERLLLLHNVRHRGYYRRLCTSCVLNNFPGSFCPICFEVFEQELPEPEPETEPPLQFQFQFQQQRRLMCFNCPSITHSACEQQQLSPPPPPPHYQCVSCRNPNFNGESEVLSIGRQLDLVSAKKLLAASKISTVLMSKTADAAWADAERKVHEAALSKRKAREAMTHLLAYHRPIKPDPPNNNNNRAAAAQDQVDDNKSHTPTPKIGMSTIVEAKKYSNGSSPVSPFQQTTTTTTTTHGN